MAGLSVVHSVNGCQCEKGKLINSCGQYCGNFFWFNDVIFKVTNDKLLKRL